MKRSDTFYFVAFVLSFTACAGMLIVQVALAVYSWQAGYPLWTIANAAMALALLGTLVRLCGGGRT